MKLLKQTAFFAVILIGIFSFNKSEKPSNTLNLNNVNALEILSEQDLTCRPNSGYLFYVESTLVKKSRGFNTVNARVYIKDRTTGQYNLLASENIAVPFHKEMIGLDYEITSRECEKISLVNGDQIVGNSNSGDYCFSELIKNETVYNSYVSSTNKLLGIDRTL
jgi:hypothetical protein